MTGKELLEKLQTLSSEELEYPIETGKYHAPDREWGACWIFREAKTVDVGFDTTEHPNGYGDYFGLNQNAIMIL